MLAVKPPVPPSADIALVGFRDPPYRRLAVVWRRSSAMAAFLREVAGQLRALSPALLEAPATSTPSRAPRRAVGPRPAKSKPAPRKKR
jgi:LysR family hydrogen peroxide-inducible transcriptional activator